MDWRCWSQDWITAHSAIKFATTTAVASSQSGFSCLMSYFLLSHAHLLASAYLLFSASTLLITSKATLKDVSSALPTLWCPPL